MARSYTNSSGVTTQNENIPWEEIKNGDTLFNYGHTYEATILFVLKKTDFIMEYQTVQWMKTSQIRVKSFKNTKEEWDDLCEKYDGDVWNDRAYIYDNVRDGDYQKYLGTIISDCFTIGIKVEFE